MEHWTFPPRYDADYLPPRDSRYWFPRRETMPPAERDAGVREIMLQDTPPDAIVAMIRRVVAERGPR